MPKSSRKVAKLAKNPLRSWRLGERRPGVIGVCAQRAAPRRRATSLRTSSRDSNRPPAAMYCCRSRHSFRASRVMGFSGTGERSETRLAFLLLLPEISSTERDRKERIPPAVKKSGRSMEPPMNTDEKQRAYPCSSVVPKGFFDSWRPPFYGTNPQRTHMTNWVDNERYRHSNLIG